MTYYENYAQARQQDFNRKYERLQKITLGIAAFIGAICVLSIIIFA